MVPFRVFLQHRRADFRDRRIGRGRRIFAEDGLELDRGEQLVALVGQVDAVDREPPVRFFKQLRATAGKRFTNGTFRAFATSAIACV